MGDVALQGIFTLCRCLQVVSSRVRQPIACGVEVAPLLTHPLGGETEVKLTGLGDATTTVVGATEILKRQEGMVTVCYFPS